MEQNTFRDFDRTPEEPEFVRFGMTFSADKVWGLRSRLAAARQA